MAKKNPVESNEFDVPEAEVPVEGLGGYTRTFTFPAESRVLEAHGLQTDLSEISDAGILYLIRLGYSTSLTQCNAGVAAAGKAEGLDESAIAVTLDANRQERLAKICAGTIGTREAAAPKEDNYVRDAAKKVLAMRATRQGSPMPKGKDLDSAIAELLAGQFGPAIRQEAQARRETDAKMAEMLAA